MKIAYMLTILLVVFMVGCATAPETPPAETPTTETPPIPPAETPPEPTEGLEEAAEAQTEEVEEPSAAEGDIVVKNAGFDPAELTVTVGSKITILSAEGDHKLTIDGIATPVIKEGTGHDVTFDKAGTVKIFDINTKKSAAVTVTEAAEAAE